MIEFYALTEPEVEAVLRNKHVWKCSIAYENGVLIAFYWHTDQYREQSCDECTMNCHIGSTPFTRPERRQEGIFNALYAWTRQQMGYDNIVYQSGAYPSDFFAVQSQFDVRFGVLSGEFIPESYQERLPKVITEFNKIAAIRGLVGIDGN
jgi:hypothetical protein